MVTMHSKTKQGLARTLEVTIAVVFTFLILIFLIPQARMESGNENTNEINLDILLNKAQFRSCLHDTNETCIEDHLQLVLPAHYTYSYVLTEDTVTPPVRSSNQEVHSVSDFVFLSNATDPSGFTTYRFILYYW